MAAMEENSIDAIVCDPPYGLEFMGKGWDHGVPGAEFWLEALRVARPGAILLAFGGTRTFHRLTCAIEDAGWEIRDCLMWLYGSGFPKSKNIGGGWGTALKPAWEPIILARKPLIGTVAANVQAHGTGAINVDGCRIGFAGEADERESKGKNRHADFGSGPIRNQVYGDFNRDRDNYNPPGRWPANVALDEDAARRLDEQSGDRPGPGFYKRPGEPKNIGARGADWSQHIFKAEKNKLRGDTSFAGESGGASRFFYTAKASRRDRDEDLLRDGGTGALRDGGTGALRDGGRTGQRGNFHPTVKPTDLMRWLVRLVTPPGGTVLDPFTGSGSTGVAAIGEGFDFIGIERDSEYAEIARLRLESVAPLLSATTVAPVEDAQAGMFNS